MRHGPYGLAFLCVLPPGTSRCGTEIKYRVVVYRGTPLDSLHRRVPLILVGKMVNMVFPIRRLAKLFKADQPIVSNFRLGKSGETAQKPVNKYCSRRRRPTIEGCKRCKTMGSMGITKDEQTQPGHELSGIERYKIGDVDMQVRSVPRHVLQCTMMTWVRPNLQAFCKRRPDSSSPQLLPSGLSPGCPSHSPREQRKAAHLTSFAPLSQ